MHVSDDAYLDSVTTCDCGHLRALLSTDLRTHATTFYCPCCRTFREDTP